MLDFFEKVLGFLDMVVQLIMSSVESLATLLLVIPSAIALPQLAALALPGIIGTSVLVVLVIGVAKLLLGR